MRFLSWNVNGYRAVLKKDFNLWLKSADADIVMLQETKVHPEQLSAEERNPLGYFSIWNHSRARKGYSGTAAFCREMPMSYSSGLPAEDYNGEGRLILMEYPGFYLFNIYFPNGQKDEERLRFKLGYYDAFLDYAQELRRRKPIVVCGDFNTAHREIDLKNPGRNSEVSGFLPIERAWLDKFISAGYIDTFRFFDPSPGRYTWWSYQFRAREKNAGWRIDYFFVSEELKSKIVRAWIEDGVQGSDHCPVGLEMDA